MMVEELEMKRPNEQTVVQYLYYCFSQALLVPYLFQPHFVCNCCYRDVQEVPVHPE